MEHWRKQTNAVIARNLLDSIASLTDGKWHSVLCVNSRGESFKKYVIELPVEKEPEKKVYAIDECPPGTVWCDGECLDI
jgi:hypothetical protein